MIRKLLKEDHSIKIKILIWKIIYKKINFCIKAQMLININNKIITINNYNLIKIIRKII